jgi:hypothetical protein
VSNTATIELTDADTFRRFTSYRIKLANKFTPKIKTAIQSQIYQYIHAAEKNGWNMVHVTLITSTPLLPPLRELYHTAAKQYGWVIYRDLIKQKGFFQSGILAKLIASIDRYFDKYILSLAQDMTDTTRKWVQKQIIEGLERGKGYEQIAREMVGSEFNLMRARRITRTESVRASNQSGIEAARLTGFKMNKRWISAMDNRVRTLVKDEADHLELNGQVIGLDDYFQEHTRDGVVPMMAPGDPEAPASSTVCCRCVLSFIGVRDTASGRLIRT